MRYNNRVAAARVCLFFFLVQEKVPIKRIQPFSFLIYSDLPVISGDPLSGVSPPCRDPIHKQLSCSSNSSFRVTPIFTTNRSHKLHCKISVLRIFKSREKNDSPFNQELCRKFVVLSMLYRIAGATFWSVSYTLYLLKRCEMKICEKTGVELPLYPSIFIIPEYAQKIEGFGLIQKCIPDISDALWCQGADALIHPERSNIQGGFSANIYPKTFRENFFIQILSIYTCKGRIRLREKIVKNWYKRWSFSLS